MTRYIHMANIEIVKYVCPKCAFMSTEPVPSGLIKIVDMEKGIIETKECPRCGNGKDIEVSFVGLG